ncbi:patatin-like phospholipase family protein [Kutzneria kofuensis]|uniref:patatin-like phospholipase family protein n=1 Tax=Kutzneria kofuensis TaxID=103725 RepID=UPI0031E97C4C
MSDEVALVLSGGGASAAYFGAGVAQGLADVGLHPTVLSGTSAGGLNAGLLAAGCRRSSWWSCGSPCRATTCTSRGWTCGGCCGPPAWCGCRRAT